RARMSAATSARGRSPRRITGDTVGGQAGASPVADGRAVTTTSSAPRCGIARSWAKTSRLASSRAGQSSMMERRGGAAGRRAREGVGEVAEAARRDGRAAGDVERLGEGAEELGAGGGREAGLVGDAAQFGAEPRAPRGGRAARRGDIVDLELELDELGDR